MTDDFRRGARAAKESGLGIRKRKIGAGKCRLHDNDVEVVMELFADDASLVVLVELYRPMDAPASC